MKKTYHITEHTYIIIMLGDTMVIEHTSIVHKMQPWFATMLILLCMLCIAQVNAQPITPPATITAPGTYELTGDVSGIYEGYGIKIESSDVILDGRGFTLRGSNRDDVGILVNKYGTSVNNVEIKNIKLGEWGTAIHYNYVKDAKGEKAGTNIVSNTQIYSSNAGVHVEYSDGITLQDIQITDTSSGLIVDHESSDIAIDKTSVTNCGTGVVLEHSRGVTLSNSNVNSCKVYGVQAENVQDLIIEKSSINDNKYAAITLADVRDFTIQSNVISRTEIGAALGFSSGVANGLIYDNHFQNRENVMKPSASNIAWNIEKQPGTNIMGGPYLGGNYWGGVEGHNGYSDTAPDSEGYGIADAPYEIDSYNIDKYPLHKTDKTSLPPEIIAPYTPGGESADEEDHLLTPESEIIKAANETGSDNVTDIRDVAVTNLFTSQPAQTPAPNQVRSAGLSSSALLSVQGMSFLVFTGAPDGATVWLIGDSGAEQAGVVTEGILTVPVNPDGPFYNSYRITAPGYTTFEERFKVYPSTQGMSVLIPVHMLQDTGVAVNVEKTEIPIMQEPEPVITSREITEFAVDSLMPTSTPVDPDPIQAQAQTPVQTSVVPTKLPTPEPPKIEEPEEDIPVEETPAQNSTSAKTGYLTFSVNVDGAKVILIDNSDVEHSAGTVTKGSLVVPIALESEFYNAYRVEKDGYDAVFEYLHDFPEAGGENKTISVTLKEKPSTFTIVTAAGSNGEISPSGETIVNHGEALTIRMTPDAGYKIEVVLVDGEPVEDPTHEYTFTDVQSDHVLVVSFK